jgi:hypothetical protein
LPNKGSITESVTLSQDAKYHDIDLANKEIVKIDGDRMIYVVGDIQINTQSQIYVPKKSSLTLYVNGNIELVSNSSIEVQDNDTTKLIIYGTENCTSIRLKSNSYVCAAIYAPSARLQMDSYTQMYGAFVGQSALLESNTTFTYDSAALALDEELALEDQNFYISRWQEN